MTMLTITIYITIYIDGAETNQTVDLFLTLESHIINTKYCLSIFVFVKAIK